MKKMTKCLTVLTAAVLLFSFAGQAGAFCVHNYSDRTMIVEQRSNGKWLRDFRATLAPTDKACCNWSNTDCNKSGGQTDPVAFDVYYVDTDFVCRDYEIPANGDLYIYKKNDGYVCGQTLPPMPVPPPQPPLQILPPP